LGDPKKARKQFNRPRSPWRSDQLAQELYLLGSYGLRNKRELWKTQTQLSSYRKQARRLLAATAEVRAREEKKLLESLRRKGLVSESATLDDILSLDIEDVLSRRLQTMIFKKGMAISPLHARQLIVHRHVAISGRRIDMPSYTVSRGEENSIALVGIKENAALLEPPRPQQEQAGSAPQQSETPAAEPSAKPGGP
jgi:small subunit ribosomal protein S4